MTRLLKKIRLYCIISKYDSFIHVREEIKWRTKNIYKTYVHILEGIWGVLSNRMKGRKLNKIEWNAIRVKYC